MKQDLLPIGTIVLLEGGTKKVMITGYSSKNKETQETYDYNGCIFPEGFMENIFCLFNHNQIVEIIYKGLENDEYYEYIEKMNSNIEFINSKNDLTSNELENSKDQVLRNRKSPSNPLSSSEMKYKYTTEKISGGQSKKFDLSNINK